MIEQDITNFHESIGKELISLKNRVRNIIGGANWAIDGTYKEAVLRNVIRRFLPEGISIGTGFVINKEKEITSQIDIIVYDNSSPVLFKEGDLVIVLAHTVRGIVEVKTRINNIRELKNIVLKCEENSRKIKSVLTENRRLFNGIFSYESSLTFESLRQSFSEYFFQTGSAIRRKVNNISLGKDNFIHLWGQRPKILNGYFLKNLSFSYFIFNLLSSIDTNPVYGEHHPLFFPLETKNPFEKFAIPSLE
jgi:hypothetical protein